MSSEKVQFSSYLYWGAKTGTVFTLSPLQRPLCVVGRLGRKKKRARGVRLEGGREKRGSCLFALPIVSRALLIFSIIAIL